MNRSIVSGSVDRLNIRGGFKTPGVGPNTSEKINAAKDEAGILHYNMAMQSDKAVQ